MFKYLIVSESNNDISRLGEIGVLSSISVFRFLSVMPVHAITLNDDFMLFDEKVNHEFIKHYRLFCKFNTVAIEYLVHFFLNIRSWICGESRKITNNPMRGATVLLSVFSRRKSLKLFSAIFANNLYLWLPLMIGFSMLRGYLSSLMETCKRAVILFFDKTILDCEFFIALLAFLCCLNRPFAIVPIVSLACVSAFVGTELGSSVGMGVSKKLIIANSTRNRNAFIFPAFATAKHVTASIYVTLWFAECFPAALAFNLHKKTSCFVNRVLAEGTQLKTRGGKNYNRFSPVDKQLCTLSTGNYTSFHG